LFVIRKYVSNYCYLYLRTSLELAQDSVTFESGFPQDVDFHGLINQQRAFDPNAGCSSLVCVVFCLLCRYSRLFITVSLDSRTGAMQCSVSPTALELSLEGAQ
jgi:hypothetical protein